MAKEYRLTSLVLGAGASATVFRGTRNFDDLHVAIKRFGDGSTSPDLAVIVDNECSALRSLGDHPCIVRMDGRFSDSAGRLCIAMELLAEGSVRSLMESTPDTNDGDSADASSEDPHSVPGGALAVFDASEVVYVGSCVAKALQHIHACGAVHCDVKPGNILFDNQRTVVKLADFGSAKLGSDTGIPEKTGLPKYQGTQMYRPPEAFRYEGATPAWDIWGLGATLLYMLTGVHIPDVEDVRLQFSRTLWNRDAWLGQLPTTAATAFQRAPPALQQAIKACLSLNPAERPSAAALLGLLSPVSRGSDDASRDPAAIGGSTGTGTKPASSSSSSGSGISGSGSANKDAGTFAPQGAVPTPPTPSSHEPENYHGWHVSAPLTLSASGNAAHASSSRHTLLVQLAFLMDCTGSMQPYVEQCKDRIREIASHIAVSGEGLKSKGGFTDLKLELAFVGYRDNPAMAALGKKPDEYPVLPFTTDVAAFETFVADVEADGGEDGPEDVAEGLRALHRLSWHSTAAAAAAAGTSVNKTAAIKIAIFIGDAPAHGTEYHAAEIFDHVPVIPSQDKLEPLMTRLGDRRIDFHFLRLKKHTAMMEKAMEAAYNDSRHNILPFAARDCSDSTDFLQLVERAVTSSLDNGVRRC